MERPGSPEALRTLEQLDRELQVRLAVCALALGGGVRDFDVRKTFFDMLDKTRVRAELHREQARRCAFCERRIAPGSPAEVRSAKPSGTRIAHLRPIDDAPELALTWSNLFGSCDTDHDPGRNHCDAAQGKGVPPQEAAPDRVDIAEYLEIQVDDGKWVPAPDAPGWVVDVLKLWNLNDRALCEARFYVLVGLEEELSTLPTAEEQTALMATRRSEVLVYDSDYDYPSTQRRWLEQELSWRGAA
jgi:uncharacterized protein (TIGR02646 family)